MQTDPRDAEPAGLPVKTLGGELMYDKEAGGKGRQQGGQQKREKEIEEALAAAAAIQVGAGQACGGVAVPRPSCLAAKQLQSQVGSSGD